MALFVDIKKSLGAFQLDVSFEAENEVLALLGASGCGKSMTLKCIAGIETPDEGKIILNGRTLFDSERHINLSPQKRRVGYLFQQYALFPNMTVRQNVCAGARRSKNGEKVDSVIKSMHLEGLEDKKPAQLSGGQQQRAALARILINEPELLLLDEPFSALDSYLKWELEAELEDTMQGFDGAAIFVSHNRGEVYRLCDNVCVLADGKSEIKRPKKELFDHPGTVASAMLSGCKNISRAERVDGGRIRALDWDVVLETDEPVLPGHSFVGVRAESVKKAAEGDKNSFLCHVDRLVDDERRYIVNLSCRGGGKIRMETGKFKGKGIKSGEEILISLPPDDIMLLRK